MIIKDGCLLCDETINHILFQCPFDRQVWALSHLSFSGFEFLGSVYANISSLFDLPQRHDIHHRLRLLVLGLFGFLWKIRIKLLFEGIGSMTVNLVDKAFEECHQWCLAQAHSHENHKVLPSQKWIPPLPDELKCNIGFAWSKKHQLSRASWVVRDSHGEVLLHSIRSFTQVLSLFDAKMQSWEWALDCMSHHHFDKFTFASSTYDIIQALHKPSEWPNVLGHITELLLLTKDKPN
ncbi:putative ribonuclease H domain-containing protein [Arabidopsis thaliana]